MNKIISAVFISLMLSLVITAYSENVQTDLQDNLIRLHIIANSDSDKDQAVKLEVRNAVLNEIRNSSENISREEIIKNLDTIEKIAKDTLKQNGFSYDVQAVYGKFDFPKKEYKNMTLPAGEYYGVRIILGNGEGHNWWCVMYPPLCVSNDTTVTLDKESEELLKATLKSETYDIITKSDKDVVIKFKAVEFIQELKQKIKKR
ncbi:MAG: stage II sporulation protein R [Clostridia bacterium]|nr:stage II sporulation protein R [Clostridia bacterium]